MLAWLLTTIGMVFSPDAPCTEAAVAPVGVYPKGAYPSGAQPGGLLRPGLCRAIAFVARTQGVPADLPSVFSEWGARVASLCRQCSAFAAFSLPDQPGGGPSFWCLAVIFESPVDVDAVLGVERAVLPRLGEESAPVCRSLVSECSWTWPPAPSFESVVSQFPPVEPRDRGSYDVLCMGTLAPRYEALLLELRDPVLAVVPCSPLGYGAEPWLTRAWAASTVFVVPAPGLPREFPTTGEAERSQR